jgi:lipopolysaccharide biosynthesis glycosyltransferase
MKKPVVIPKSEIPVIFSTDDNYIAYLDVAIASLIENASKMFSYRIIVLNTGLRQENVDLVKRRECAGFVIDFVDISREVESIKGRFQNVYHFSVVTYYRLFIASLFPQYDKVIYLDCDLVVLGDISELYHTRLGDNILAAAPEQFVRSTPAFRRYAQEALGVDPDGYVNAGVLVINLKAFRKNRIEERFVELITDFQFDLLDPDQAYLNYLCQDRILVLPNGWNKEPMELDCEGKKNIVHYALYKKPWQYDDVLDGNCFWNYAARSPFLSRIQAAREAFDGAARRKAENTAREILAHADRISDSEDTFVKLLGRKEDKDYGKISS